MNIASGSAAVSYNSATGIITITTSAAHGLSAGDEIRLLKESLAFTCTLDNNTSVKRYTLVLQDPIFDGNAPGGTDFNGTTDGDYSRPITLRSGTTGSTLVFSVTTDDNSSNVGSRAEYIRDINGGAYGYFRGFFENDPSQDQFQFLDIWRTEDLIELKTSILMNIISTL